MSDGETRIGVTRDRTDRFLCGRREAYGAALARLEQNASSFGSGGFPLVAFDETGVLVGPWRAELLDQRRLHRLSNLKGASLWLEVELRLQELSAHLGKAELAFERFRELTLLLLSDQETEDRRCLELEIARGRRQASGWIQIVERRLGHHVGALGVRIGVAEVPILAEIVRPLAGSVPIIDDGRDPSLIRLFRFPSEKLERLRVDYASLVARLPPQLSE